MSQQENYAQTIATEARKPVVLFDEFDNERQIALPVGYQLHDCEHLLPHPRRATGRTTLHDTDSFIAYAKRIGSLTSTAIYINADYAKNQVSAVAIFNDHEDQPGWRDHTATLQPRITEEWKTWTAGSGQWKKQIDFAHFLEQNLPDIVAPNGSDVLTFVTQLEEQRNVKYRSGVNLQNGMVQIEFVEDGSDATKGKLELFKEFTIGVRPFFGGEAYSVKAALRYRIDRNSGEIAFMYELQRPEKIIEDAAKVIVDSIKEQAGFPVFFGTPN
ncbi:DUF2303 family protein [Chitinilyticum aquatile]|uniref:DUF2303 family protein n=1 Tax=Chitinilyticum aquatile TaxID=362520 RepID=UPI000416B2C4|nr:DUF2303 family protein [Chitinilyticum aquatile]